jgi:hypothetical protein
LKFFAIGCLLLHGGDQTAREGSVDTPADLPDAFRVVTLRSNSNTAFALRGVYKYLNGCYTRLYGGDETQSRTVLALPERNACCEFAANQW